MQAAPTMRSKQRTHLVGEDAVEAVLPQADEPADALELVVAQLALDEGQQGLHARGGTVDSE